MLGICQEECVACGLCARIKPEYFSLDEHGFAFIKKSPKNSDSELQELIKKCPSNCIYWEQS